MCVVLRGLNRALTPAAQALHPRAPLPAPQHFKVETVPFKTQQPLLEKVALEYLLERWLP